MSDPKTLFDKIWESHVVAENDDGTTLLYIDKHLIHEVTSWTGFERMAEDGRPVRRPDATLGVPDHSIPTRNRAAGVDGIGDPLGRSQVEALIANCEKFGVPLIPLTDVRQGIVHIIGPEQGLTLPGATLVCGDSHTATHGAFGCLAFGIGSSEVEHVLATQTLSQKRPRNMRITVAGDLPAGITGKDMILATIGEIGTAGGTGHVVEYAGPAIRALSMEGRMTVCNMTIEGGARAGLIAPDETTFAYLKGRPMAPSGAAWDQAMSYWRTLASDEGAAYDKEATIQATDIAPQITWGTSPEDVIPVTGRTPDPAAAPDEMHREAIAQALGLHGVGAGFAHRGRGGGSGLHRLLHQRPDRGSARRRRRRQGPQGAGGCRRHGGARLRPGEAAGRGGRARPYLPRSRLRMARSGLFHVHRHERRQARAGRALRVHLQSQLQGPPGPRRSHPSGEPGDGRGSRRERAFR